MDQLERERFGAYIKSLREAKGLTQREAGKEAAVSCPYVAQLERGQRNPPSREIMLRMASAYSVNPTRLLEAAGYASEQSLNNIPAERINWAFETVLRDPDWTFGTRARASDFSVESKAFIVEVYQRDTGRNLLTGEEIEISKGGRKIAKKTAPRTVATVTE